MLIKNSEIQLPVDDRFMALFEQSPLSIQIMSPDGRIVQVNKAWENLWGVTLDQLDGYNILEDEQLKEKGVMPYIERAFGGQSVEIPLVHYDPNVTIPDLTRHVEPKRWTKAVIYPIKNSVGQVQEIVLIHEDITDRIRNEEQIKVNELSYNSLLENANDIIYSHDLLGNYISVNRAAEKITGYPLEELRKMNITQLIVPEHHERIRQVIESKFHDPTPSIHEFDLVTKDGRRITLEVNPRVSLIEKETLAIEGVARDITKRKQMENDLHKSEQRLRLAMQAAKIYSWEIDLLTQEVTYSENAAALSDLESLIKNFTEISEIIHPEDLEHSLEMYERALEGSGTFTHQYRVVNLTKGTFWNESHAVAVRDADGTPVRLIGITQNINERKMIEEVRLTWAARLEEAREEERRRLSLQLHDDIVQQLAVASIKLQRVEKKLVELLPEENAVFADLVITQELLHRNQISLRQMAQILHSGVLEQFGLAEAFRKFTQNVDTFLTDQPTAISLNFADNFPRLAPAVENGIYRTTQEAVINALKHSQAKSISVTLDIREGLAFVIVRDDGCGFDLERIESNGIGLASMYERAELIDATLNISSKEGKGTTVNLAVLLEKSRRKA
jgi:PAS domain S-box-containing protein